jgi:hypothetical protein
MEVIAAPHVKSARQPIHTDPDEIRRGFKPKQAMGLDMHMEETNPLRFGNSVLERVDCVAPQHGFPAAEV